MYGFINYVQAYAHYCAKNKDRLPSTGIKEIHTHPTRTDDVNSSAQLQRRQPTSCKTKYAFPAHL